MFGFLNLGLGVDFSSHTSHPSKSTSITAAFVYPNACPKMVLDK